MRAADWGGRVVLLLGGCLAAVALLEVALQVGAWWVRSSSPPARARAGWQGDAHRVLCLGDSNTFGLAVDPAEAYPAQLERLWNESVASPRIQVMNAGYPGTNSSTVAAELPALLGTLAPDTVLVMIGVNDFWTRAAPVGPPAGGGGPAAAAPSPIDLRVVRLLSLLRSRLPTGDPPPPGDGSPGDAIPIGTPSSLRRHLDSILASARAAGVTPVLLTYPSGRSWYAIASRRTRAAGRDGGARVVDLERVFAQRCSGGACDLLRDDGHPTAAGYRVMAETLVEERAIDRQP